MARRNLSTTQALEIIFEEDLVINAYDSAPESCYSEDEKNGIDPDQDK